jgi:hypothetical protein
VIFALVVGLTARIVLVAFTPVAGPGIQGRLSSYNDEIAHGVYAFHIVTEGRLPVSAGSIQDAESLSKGGFENYQPPLYYLATAGLARLIGTADFNSIVLIGRLINVVLWLGLIGVLLGIAAQLKLGVTSTGTGVIFLALSGVFVRFTSICSNDALFWLVSGALLWSLLRVRDRGLSAVNLSVLGLLLTIALYSKSTSLLFVPLILFVMHRPFALRSLFAVSIMLGAVVVLTLPVWLRNVRDFGSMLPLSSGFGTATWHVPSGSFLKFASRSFVFPWTEFWSGAVDLVVLLPFVVLLIMGLVVALKAGGALRNPALSGSLIMAISAFIWLNAQYDQAEGRYLFAAWPALALAWPSSSRPAMLWLVVAAMLAPYSLFILPSLGI